MIQENVKGVRVYQETLYYSRRDPSSRYGEREAVTIKTPKVCEQIGGSTIKSRLVGQIQEGQRRLQLIDSRIKPINPQEVDVWIEKETIRIDDDPVPFEYMSLVVGSKKTGKPVRSFIVDVSNTEQTQYQIGFPLGDEELELVRKLSAEPKAE